MNKDKSNMKEEENNNLPKLVMEGPSLPLPEADMGGSAGLVGIVIMSSHPSMKGECERENLMGGINLKGGEKK